MGLPESLQKVKPVGQVVAVDDDRIDLRFVSKSVAGRISAQTWTSTESFSSAGRSTPSKAASC